MTIDEAIKILDEEEITCEPGRKTILEDALKLGIEALKREKHYRFMHPLYNEGPLPGETKD